MAQKGEASSDANKITFKFKVAETVNADPKMSKADLAVIVAYLTFLSWPSCKAWLSTSRARAMTNLSERQITYCRTHLMEQGYLVEAGMRGTTKVFRVQNPRAEIIDQHVALATEHYRERQAERRAERRRAAQTVPAKSAETEDDPPQANEDAVSATPAETEIPTHDLSPQNLPRQTGQCLRKNCGDVSAMVAGHSVYSNRKGRALETEELPIRTSVGPSHPKPEPLKVSATVAVTSSVHMTAEVFKPPPRRPQKQPAENAYCRHSQGW